MLFMIHALYNISIYICLMKDGKVSATAENVTKSIKSGTTYSSKTFLYSPSAELKDLKSYDRYICLTLYVNI